MRGGAGFQPPDGAIRTSHLTSCVYNSPLSAIPHQLTRFKQSHLPRRNWLILFLPPYPPSLPPPNLTVNPKSNLETVNKADEMN